MKCFRVGSCLVLLMAAAACSQAPQALTSPTGALGASTAETAAADGSTLKVTAPAIISPSSGERAEDRRPTLIWLNSSGRYGSVGVAYDIELSTPTEVVYTRTVGESPDIGAHLVDLELQYDTVYSWRIRAHLGGPPDTYGPWSNWASFLSPSRPVAVAPPVGNNNTGTCTAPLSPMGPGETRRPRPNHFYIVQGIAGAFPAALRNSCQDHGGSWEFMDRTIDALRAVDGRYGYNCKRGNCNDPSVDVASYFYGNHTQFQGSPQVYIFDLITSHCGANPGVWWNDVTDITASSGTEGRTTYPRPGRNVTSTPCQ
jgi:hypothetical protein